jgi:DNA polymerase-3 subunit gamma/tau
VTAPLEQALDAKRLHHAYLFSGPRGCGKTTSARILARCLNCEEGPTARPCGVCDSCVGLSRDGGGSLDVVEIDAASHNGVDDARDLRERAVFSPARDRFKIFILDEAHMVTQQGFNALLKIVEEPPDHVVFIFATTEPEKVLATIRSRTHHYPFRLVGDSDLLPYLKSVADAEGVRVEEGTLKLVIRSGGGSVRDSISILDQLIAGCRDGEIRLDDAQALLGYTPRVALDELLTALSDRDPKKVFAQLASLLASGHDPRGLVRDLLSYLRDIIVLQATGGEASGLFPGESPDHIARLQEQAHRFSKNRLAVISHMVHSSLGEMSGLTSLTLEAELLFARLLAAGEPVQRENMQQQSPADTGQTSADSKPEDQPVSIGEQSKVLADSPAEEQAAEELAAENLREEPLAPLEPWDVEAVSSLWPAIVADLAQQKRSLWVALSTTKVLGLEEDVLTIGFARRNDAEILKKPQGPGSPLANAEILREAIHRHTGRHVRFTIAELAPENLHVAESASRHEPAEEESEDTDNHGSIDSLEGSEVEKSDHEAQSPRPDSLSPAPGLASRGEPVVRQLLGGELIEEELWERDPKRVNTDD